MSRKFRIIALAIFTLMAIGAYAVDLVEGYYQMSGSADHIKILPNKEYYSKYSGPVKKPIITWHTKIKKGSYAIVAYKGLPANNDILWRGTGEKNGSNLMINIQDITVLCEEMLAELGTSLYVGTLEVFEISDSRTFYDAAGEKWFWRRN